MKNNIVINFDDVLCNISFEIYNTVIKNISSFGYFLKNPLNLDNEKTFDSRPIKNILKNYGRNDITPIEAIRFYMLIKKKFYESSFCDAIEPSNVLQKMLSKTLLDSNNVDNVYIICNYNNEYSKQTKTKFIHKHFNHHKIHIIYNDTHINQNMLSLVRSLDWKLYITENLDDIKQIVETDDYKIDKKEFLIKATGYNEIPVSLQKLVELKNATINYYKEEY